MPMKLVRRYMLAELMYHIHKAADYTAMLWRLEHWTSPRNQTKDVASKAAYVVTLDRQLKKYAI